MCSHLSLSSTLCFFGTYHSGSGSSSLALGADFLLLWNVSSEPEYTGCCWSCCETPALATRLVMTHKTLPSSAWHCASYNYSSKWICQSSSSRPLIRAKEKYIKTLSTQQEDRDHKENYPFLIWMPQSHVYYFTKRKENKDLPSLKSRNTESKGEMYKGKWGMVFKSIIWNLLTVS